jgi:hypothetical protein
MLYVSQAAEAVMVTIQAEAAVLLGVGHRYLLLALLVQVALVFLDQQAATVGTLVME